MTLRERNLVKAVHLGLIDFWQFLSLWRELPEDEE